MLCTFDANTDDADANTDDANHPAGSEVTTAKQVLPILTKEGATQHHVRLGLKKSKRSKMPCWVVFLNVYKLR
jgi:hypothetical protein